MPRAGVRFSKSVNPCSVVSDVRHPMIPFAMLPALVLPALVALSAVPAPAIAEASKAPLFSACFPAADLKAKPGEEIVVHKPNAYAPFTEPATLVHAQPVPPALRGAIRRVDIHTGQKVVALTFDLCEQPGEIAGYDGRIIDLLRREGVKATLFAGGKWLQTHPERAQQLMSDPLFEIANHSETHRNFRLIDAREQDNQIFSPERAYERLRAQLAVKQCAVPAERMAAVPERMTLFRFPYGACSIDALNAVNDAGMLAIQWDLSTGDPDKNVSQTAIAREIVRRAKPGSIIIGHANGRGWHTAEGFEIAIPKLRALGFSFVTVSELLAMGTPVVENRCYNERPGDTDRYDHPVSLNKPNHAKAGQKGDKINSATATGTPATPKKAQQ